MLLFLTRAASATINNVREQCTGYRVETPWPGRKKDFWDYSLKNSLACLLARSCRTRTMLSGRQLRMQGTFVTIQVCAFWHAICSSRPLLVTYRPDVVHRSWTMDFERRLAWSRRGWNQTRRGAPGRCPVPVDIEG